MAISTKTYAVAGSGISNYYSISDAMIKNPATVSAAPSNELDFGVSIISPTAQASSLNGFTGEYTAYTQSDIQHAPVPYFSYGKNFGKWAFGTGLVPIAGLG